MIYHVSPRLRSQVDPFYLAENAATAEEAFTFPAEHWCANQGIDPWTDVSCHLSLQEAAAQLSKA